MKPLIMLVAFAFSSLIAFPALATWTETGEGSTKAGKRWSLAIPAGAAVNDYSDVIWCESDNGCIVSVDAGTFALYEQEGADPSDTADYADTGQTVSSGSSILNLKQGRAYRLRMTVDGGAGLVLVTGN